MTKLFRHPISGEDMPDQRRNGTGSLTYQWLAGILLTILMAGGAGWMTNLNAQVVSQADRLARVETAVLRLPIIEQKLDRVLEAR